MNAQELWNKYKKINPSIGDDIDAWQFGVEADLLAQLVLEGTKTATASAYDLYAVDNDPLPEVGSYDVVLDSQDQAVCKNMKHKSIINTLLLTILCGCSNTISPSDSQTSASSNYIKPESFKVYDIYLDEGYPDEHTFVLEEFEVVYPTL